MDTDPTAAVARGAWRMRIGHWHDRLAQLPPAARGLLWATASGFVFSVLNALTGVPSGCALRYSPLGRPGGLTGVPSGCALRYSPLGRPGGLMRVLAQQLDPFQAQFLRYLFGFAVLLPLVWHQGLAAWRPQRVRGQFARGAVHTLGLALWFVALPRIPLADMTAIGFTTPIFIMVGAWIFFGERMRWDRWLASLLGLAGVFVVVAPQLSGSGGGYHLVMLASAPVFAASFLITKALTRCESTGVILLWQAITVTVFSLPLALLQWQPPTPWQWAGFVLCGALGSAGHYCLTRSFRSADISATQSTKFLDLVWAALLGWLLFADVPSASTLAGGVLISAATIWIARRESRS